MIVFQMLVLVIFKLHIYRLDNTSLYESLKRKELNLSLMIYSCLER